MESARPGLHASTGLISVQHRWSIEACDRHERVGRVDACGDAHHGHDSEIPRQAVARAIQRPPLDTVDGVVGDNDEDLVPTRHGAGDHGIHLRNDGAPRSLSWFVHRRSHHTTSRRAHRRGADQLIVSELEVRDGLHTCDHGCPRGGGAVEQERFAVSPTHQHLHQEEAPVGGNLHVGPRLRMCRVAPHHLVGRGLGSQRMEHHPPVVLITLRTCRVVEAGCVGEPGNRGCTSLGDGVVERLPAVDVEHGQRAVLGAALAGAERHERTIGGGEEPIDSRGGIGRRSGWIEQHGGLGCSIGAGAQNHRVLLCARCSFEHEQSVSATFGLQHHGQAHERDEALVPLATIGPGIERLTSVFVLQGHPFPGGGCLAVLQPPIGIGDRDAVDHITVRPSGCRRRYRGGVSHAPCSDAYRGWPWNGAFWPCASWSSSTWRPSLAAPGGWTHLPAQVSG